jgi:Tfp pilus assembly ATPase PilU
MSRHPREFPAQNQEPPTSKMFQIVAGTYFATQRELFGRSNVINFAWSSAEAFRVQNFTSKARIGLRPSAL